ncbi:hypothetical protein [Agrobacterium tumefaciens]|uniref:hypothetical protein n=1 Tax=Agrobacterium tumefaciens TaxID=358 RepID=UPI000459F869|nr:hypothetical protein [Agrobacterium tumefaciens]CDN91362.1 hypothetical protein BN949_00496 [Agrobacterium tumefaciens]
MKPLQPFVFDPEPSAINTLYAKWLPLYVAQATLDDQAAEPFQAQLIDLETAIDALPFTSMEEYHLQQAVQTCLGSMANLDGVQAAEARRIATAEGEEREKLLALISEHRATLDASEALTVEEFEQAGGDEIGQKEVALLMQVASFPAVSAEAILLKGRYLVALHANHALGFEFAEAFVESFAALGRASA